VVRTDPQINFDWLYSRPDKALSGASFSVRWQGDFSLEQGDYVFTATTSDGMRLYIDGMLMLDRWRDQPVCRYTVSTVLSRGSHRIRVEYYTRGSTPVARLSWQTLTPAMPAPTISLFTATPGVIAAGGSATLSWAVSGASSVNIDNGIGDVSNATTRVVSPAQTTSYKLTASSSGGVVTAVATVTVAPSTTPDSQAPSSPALSPAAAVSATRVDLAWTASRDNVGVTGYRVIRNGTVLATVPRSVLAYSDASAASNTTYTYTVQAFDATGNLSAPSNARVVATPAATGCQPGDRTFVGCYCFGTDLTGTPVLTRTDSQINFDWTSAPPAPAVPHNNFSVRWQGRFMFDQGTYLFSAASSDGMRIYVDGNLTLDRWRDQPLYMYRLQRLINQGIHTITVEFYARTGTPFAQLSWTKQQ